MKELRDMKTAELKEYAAANGIELGDVKKKADILKRIDTVSADAAAKVESSRDATVNRLLKVTKPLMQGEDVRAVQNALIGLRLFCGVKGADGVYNARTAFAVRMFQAHNRLIVSGKVDEHTARWLGIGAADAGA